MSEIYRLSEARRSRKQRHMDRCRYHVQAHRSYWAHQSAHHLRWTAICAAWLEGGVNGPDCRIIDTREAGK